MEEDDASSEYDREYAQFAAEIRAELKELGEDKKSFSSSYDPEDRGWSTCVSDANEKRRVKALRKFYGLDVVPNDPDFNKEGLSDGFDVNNCSYPSRLIKSLWGDDYDIALYGRLGLHCYNFHKWARDHKAVIRKTMDGKPGHIYLEVAAAAD